MTNQFTYPVKLTKQHKGFLAKLPDFPEAITQGDTKEDALIEALDCLEEAIANRIEMKLPIPFPKKRLACKHYVTLHASFAVKVALYRVFTEKKISNVVLAKKLSCDEKEVRRLLDPHYRSKFPRIEEALHALGKKIKIEIVPL